MKVSVVIPVYQDSSSLNELLTRLDRVAQQAAWQLEVLLVDDGSGNDVWQTLLCLKQQHPLTLMRLTKNKGQHFATLCGLLHSSGEVVITMDADLQHPPEEIPKLINQLNQQRATLVYGSAGDGHPASQRFGSWLFKRLLQQLDHPASRYANAFRAIDRRLITQITNWQQPFYSIDTALLALSARTLLTRTDHHQRHQGTSAYNTRRKLKLALATFYYSRGFFRCAAILMALLGFFGILLLPLALRPNASSNMPSITLASSLLLASVAGLLILKLLYRRACQKQRQPQAFIAEIVS